MKKTAVIAILLSFATALSVPAETLRYEYNGDGPFAITVKMDVTAIDDSRIEITVMKDMDSFPHMVWFTAEAKYESGRYVFSGAMDGFENEVSGHVTFEGADNETAILFMDANFIGGLANVGRLYGVTNVMTKGSPGNRPLPRNENRYPEPRALAPEGAQYTIEGVWSYYKGNSMLNAFERNLSWGRMLVPAEDGFVVDLHADPPTVEIFDSARMGKSDLNYITGIKEEGNRSEMTIAADWYSEGDITVFFNFNEDGTVWIDKKPGANAYWWALGRNHVYNRFDPEAEKAKRAGVFQITHVTTADLPLLEMADTEAKVLMQLPKGSSVQLVFQITRNPKTADSVPWSRLVLPDGTAGWVFTDTGLQEVVADTAKSAARLFLLLPVPLAAAGFFFAKKLNRKGGNSQKPAA